MFEALPWAAAEANLDELLALGYSTSLFTRWTDAGIDQIWVKSTAPLDTCFGATVADGPRHPIVGADPANATEQPVRSLRPLGPILTPLLLTSEIRAVAADSLWLSPFHERDSICIHFTWKPLGTKVHAVLPRIEAALAPLQHRPHWGKVFIQSPAPRYPRLAAFRALRARLDPERIFGNAFDDQFGT